MSLNEIIDAACRRDFRIDPTCRIRINPCSIQVLPECLLRGTWHGFGLGLRNPNRLTICDSQYVLQTGILKFFLR